MALDACLENAEKFEPQTAGQRLSRYGPLLAEVVPREKP